MSSVDYEDVMVTVFGDTAIAVDQLAAVLRQLDRQDGPGTLAAKATMP
jgi:hypothetical protein